MLDLWLSWGSDLVVGPTGDLAFTTGSQLGQQRVIRRLLTNEGGYIWQPNYGAGLGSFVGSPINVAHLRAVIRGQIFSEPTVSSTREPIIKINQSNAGNGDTVHASIEYSGSTNISSQIVDIVLGN